MTDGEVRMTTALTRREQLQGAVDDLRERMVERSMWLLVGMLGVTAVDWASRSTLSVVFDDIKAQFHVSDAALGGLVAAYSVVATLSAIPAGILADKWRRGALIALGFLPWGIAMIWQGAATSFGMLFVARMFLGSVEASNDPASTSLIGDYYSVGRRARVMGLWRVGFVIGSAIGFGVAGAVAQTAGWRASFVVFGLLGFVCGGLVWRLLPEPERGIPDRLHRAEQRLVAFDAGKEPDSSGAHGVGLRELSVGEAVKAVLAIRTARVMMAAAAIGEFVFAGLGAWAPTFFRRYHHLGPSGAALVNVFVLAGVLVGAYMGSRLGDSMLAKGNLRGRVLLGAGFFSLSALVSIPALTTNSTPLAIGLLTITGFCLYVPVPSLWAMWLDIVPPELRGRASGLSIIARSGLSSIAPWIIGVISDAAGLRVAFLVIMPALLVNGLLYLLARDSYAPDAAKAQRLA